MSTPVKSRLTLKSAQSHREKSFNSFTGSQQLKQLFGKVFFLFLKISSLCAANEREARGERGWETLTDGWRHASRFIFLPTQRSSFYQIRLSYILKIPFAPHKHCAFTHRLLWWMSAEYWIHHAALTKPHQHKQLSEHSKFPIYFAQRLYSLLFLSLLKCSASRAPFHLCYFGLDKH